MIAPRVNLTYSLIKICGYKISKFFLSRYLRNGVEKRYWLKKTCISNCDTDCTDSFLMPSISLRMWPTSFWDAYYLSYIEYIQSGVCQYEIMEFCYVILRGPVFLLTNSDLNLMPVRISYLIEVPIPYIQLLKIILFRHNYAHTYIFAVKITKQKKKKRFIWLPSRLENNYEISAKPNLSMEVRCISNNICIRFINFQISCFTLCNIFAVRMAEGAYS